MEGKVRAALQLLTKGTESGSLKLDDVEESGKTVRDILKDKHPHSEPPHPDVLLSSDVADNESSLTASQPKQFVNLLY